MAAYTAISVNDYFAARHSAVALGSAHYESAGGIDIYLRLFVHHFRGDDLPDDFLDYSFPHCGRGNVGVMLGRDNDCVHPYRLSVYIFDGNLALSVGPQEM